MWGLGRGDDGNKKEKGKKKVPGVLRSENRGKDGTNSREIPQTTIKDRSKAYVYIIEPRGFGQTIINQKILERQSGT